MPVCDGCGERVDEHHIRRRIERLELATRFRPIHINVLLMDAAPPLATEDFFYAPGGTARSAAGRRYFDELAKLAGAGQGSTADTEAILSEFQHRGFFLASAVECPVADGAALNAIIRRLAPTVLRRVQASYKPKYVALISQAAEELIEPFRAAGWGDRLILDHGAPFAADSLAGQLTAALARAS